MTSVQQINILSDFSYLMRAVLENSEEDFIPLEKEIELIRTVY